MPNDSLIRALRRFTLTAGIALIAVPLLGPALDLLDLKCVFRTIMTARFGSVTAEFGNVTGHFGDVTDGVIGAA